MSKKKGTGGKKEIDKTEFDVIDQSDIPLGWFSEEDQNLGLPTRDQIALDTLMRYSDTSLEEFNDFILLTNFPHYVDAFAEHEGVNTITGTVLRSAHSPSNNISIIDYRVGAPMAALIIDVLSYIRPQAVVMLGLCGGLHRYHNVGDFLLPVAAIRDEGASKYYMPPQVPSLPAFLVQQFISEELMHQEIPFQTGVLHTTDYRMWEFDEQFREKLKQEKASAIEMECSALFTAGFSRKVPVGALMLISDLPFKPEGIKTKKKAKEFFNKYTSNHLLVGIDCMKRMNEATHKTDLNFRRFHFTVMN